MIRVFSLLEIILPILFAFTLGYLFKKKALINEGAIEGIKTLVMSFMLPCVVFNAFYKTEFSPRLLIIAVAMFVVCLAGFGLGSVFSRLKSTNFPMMPFLTTGFEAGMMGFGLYAMLFNGVGVYNFALVDLGQVLFIFTIYMALLNRKKAVSASATIKKMFTTPVFIAILSGIIVSTSGLGNLITKNPIGSPINSILNYLSAPTGVLMIFVVGYQLVLEKSCLKSALITITLRTVIMGILCSVLLIFLKGIIDLEEPLFWAIILMFSLPAPFVLPIFSGDKEQKGYIATSLSLGTILSLIFFTIITLVKQ